METLASVRDCLKGWNGGGSATCRKMLLDPHSSPSDPDSNDVLATVYHALIVSTLVTWPSDGRLTTDSFVAFVQSVLDQVASSSIAVNKSSNVVIFGEMLVDIIWSIDSELDEVLVDVRNVSSTAEQGSTTTGAGQDELASDLAKVVKVKQSAEADKKTLTDILKRLLGIGILNATVCRERLDLSLVAGAGLIADKVAFDRKEIRIRTHLFYKQNKFNLLREQTEGYSKLTTELTSCLGPPNSAATGRPAEDLAAIEARARPAWERVVGLIGYFDLDPNRALDIILDVFSTHLATHYAFFISFLSLSPWAVRSEPRVMSSEGSAAASKSKSFRGKSLDEILMEADALSDSELEHPMILSGGPQTKVLAQVLGFKFSHYQSPDVPETTPRSMYLMTAILIKEGFVTLEDVYAHVTPSDEDMDVCHKEYLASVDARIEAAKYSQLAMAAPLESSGSQPKLRPAVVPESRKASEDHKLPNQKLCLLNALLAVGALRPAIAILSKFPWVVDAAPELADLLLRVLKHSVSSLYDTTFPPKEPNINFTQPRARYGSTGIVPATARRPQLTLWAPAPPSTSATDFVFFYPDWIQRVPICSSVEDLPDVVEPLMRLVGVHISRDPVLISKLLRLGRARIQDITPIDPETKKAVSRPDADHPWMQFWFKILRLYLLPALPLIRGNAVCTVEVWGIVRCFDTTLRWQLYGEWKSKTYSSHPELRVRQVQADRESKGIMRRLSHNTIDSLSGTVAKLAHSNPIIFFTNAVNQVMAYDNLAGVVIQALNYVTVMGFDVLIFVILDALANPYKDRVKDDGVNTADWLQSLASFTGMLYRRYSADIKPILEYIVHQLQNAQYTEIIVLRELIWKMAGVEPLPSLSDTQITAMAGGPTLRVESVASTTRGARLDPGDVQQKGPSRLGHTLLESSLATPLLIQVAQQRELCVYQKQNAFLKSLASLFDQTHGVLLQYLELLTSPGVLPKMEDYDKQVVPSLTELSLKYKISSPICMQIFRPILNAALLNAALAMQERERVASEEAEKRLKAALTAKREPNASGSRVASPAVGEANGSAEARAEKSAVSEQPQSDVPMEVAENGQTTESPWLQELEHYFDEVKQILPENAANLLGPAFYLTFWQLSMYDLQPPAAKYDEECSNLRTLSRQEDSNYVVADRSSDRAKRLSANTHRLRRDRYNTFVSELGKELKEQTIARMFTIKRLTREKDHWFSQSANRASIAHAIVEHCIQPRCLLSPMDADFSAHFIRVMHSHGTPGFSTLMCYDKILMDHMGVVVFSCSEYEARNYGRFLRTILKDGLRWFQDEQTYQQDNRTKVGGKTVYLPGFVNKKVYLKPLVHAEDVLPHADYVQVYRKWYRKISRCLIDCINTGEFMHVYNSIVVLKELLPVFPLREVAGEVGNQVDEVMVKFLAQEERGDLKILGRAYHASLKKREHLWATRKPLDKTSTDTQSPRPAPAINGTDKGRAAVAPAVSGPAIITEDRPSVSALPATTPSAPRAQLAGLNGSAQAPPERPGSNTSATKLAMESIPRPDVVKRVRPEVRSSDVAPRTSESAAKVRDDAMDVDHAPVPAQTSPPASLPSRPPRAPTGDLRSSRSETSVPVVHAPVARPAREPPRLRDVPMSPAPTEPAAGHSTDAGPPASVSEPRLQRTEAMPPPAIPSQTPSAHELRETAKQGQSRPVPEVEERAPPPAAVMEARSQAPSAAPSPAPRRRTPSPSSRPGTRSHSVESRASAGRRSNRGDERPEDKRPERDVRPDLREPPRRDTPSHPRENGARRTRDTDREKESERERERGRDRHGERERRERDRDRDRERDKERERERERDRESHRERDRDRDRDRERDRDRDRERHRREEKDRERESRKEREAGARGSLVAAGAPAVDERGLPTRPDLSRHRVAPPHEDISSKRRRTEDESERTSKRSSRKESHHDDRTRRSTDKDLYDRPRESDRRRRERDAAESEGKILAVDTKFGDKRPPEGPSSAKSLPPSTPSAPRAMAGDGRGPKPDAPREREWKPSRDQPPTGPSSMMGSSTLDSMPSGRSLQSRLSAKDLPLPQAPLSYRSDLAGDRRGELPLRDDDRDGGRKRTLSERDKELDASLAGSDSAMPAKRPRINRNRYQQPLNTPHGVARKLLPIDPQAGEKSRNGRD